MHLWYKIWKSQVIEGNVDRLLGTTLGSLFTPQTGLKAIQFYLKWFSTVGMCEKWSFPAFLTSFEPRRIKHGIDCLLHKHEMLGIHVGLFIYWLFLQGYSAYFHSEWITGFEWQRLQSSGKQNELLSAGFYSPGREVKQTETVLQSVTRPSVTFQVASGVSWLQRSDASHAEGFVLFRDDLSSRQVRLWKLKYFSSPPKQDLPVRKVILSFSHPSCPSRFLIFDIRAVIPRRPFLKPQWWRLW